MWCKKSLLSTIAAVCAALSSLTFAALPAVSSDQLRALQQLSPEQKAALLRMAGQEASKDVVQAPPSTPEIVLPPSATPAPPSSAVEAGPPAVDAYTDQASGLKRFGYDLFDGVPTTFAPATDIPVPADFVLGPGDVIQVQLFGKENQEYTLAVSRDGTVNFPGLGVMAVAGQTFDAVKADIKSRVGRQLIGMQANVSMGPLRSIRIFVLGEANRPGSYTVSSLSTMTNALFVSGGVKPIGSLRNVALKRAGRLVTTLDLYDLLLRGDTSKDQRLQPGDVIFIPPVGNTVGIQGEVLRPGIYELKNERTIAEVLALSGGAQATADLKKAQLERVTDQRELTIVDLDLTQESAMKQEARNGDLLKIHPIVDEMNQIVTVQGHVYRPGKFQWRPGLRLTELIAPQDIKPEADLKYVVILRETGPARMMEALSLDLERAFAEPSSAANVPLQGRDKVMIFASGEERQEKLTEVIQKLGMQAELGQQRKVVSVGGRIRHPGEYPLEQGMRIGDLIRAGGGLQESAYQLSAELSRYEIKDDEFREIRHVNLNLPAIIRGEPEANIMLQPYDVLRIKELPQWREYATVKLGGEVRFPGTYQIKEGEKLSDLIQRAGGLTKTAYPEGAFFARASLQEKEQENIRQLAKSLETDLALMSVEQSKADAKSLEMVTALQDMLRRLQETQAKGRLVIDLPAVLTGRAEMDVVLENGDQLYIPSIKQEVTVVGEVFYPTSHLFVPGKDWEKYINLSGGTTKRADEDRSYVVRANGAVEKVDDRAFKKKGIQPGDTIVVPMDAERFSRLQLWTSVSQIVYQLGLAAASWHAIGLF
ncbi:MAG: SLBB domain-containing protein [Pseudomonadota bacterium]